MSKELMQLLQKKNEKINTIINSKTETKVDAKTEAKPDAKVETKTEANLLISAFTNIFKKKEHFGFTTSTIITEEDIRILFLIVQINLLKNPTKDLDTFVLNYYINQMYVYITEELNNKFVVDKKTLTLIANLITWYSSISETDDLDLDDIVKYINDNLKNTNFNYSTIEKDEYYKILYNILLTVLDSHLYYQIDDNIHFVFETSDKIVEYYNNILKAQKKLIQDRIKVLKETSSTADTSALQKLSDNIDDNVITVDSFTNKNSSIEITSVLKDINRSDILVYLDSTTNCKILRSYLSKKDTDTDEKTLHSNDFAITCILLAQISASKNLENFTEKFTGKNTEKFSASKNLEKFSASENFTNQIDTDKLKPMMINIKNNLCNLHYIVKNNDVADAYYYIYQMIKDLKYSIIDVSPDHLKQLILIFMKIKYELYEFDSQFTNSIILYKDLLKILLYLLEISTTYSVPYSVPNYILLFSIEIIERITTGMNTNIFNYSKLKTFTDALESFTISSQLWQNLINYIKNSTVDKQFNVILDKINSIILILSNSEDNTINKAILDIVEGLLIEYEKINNKTIKDNLNISLGNNDITLVTFKKYRTNGFTDILQYINLIASFFILLCLQYTFEYSIELAREDDYIDQLYIIYVEEEIIIDEEECGDDIYEDEELYEDENTSMSTCKSKKSIMFYIFIIILIIILLLLFC